MPLQRRSVDASSAHTTIEEPMRRKFSHRIYRSQSPRHRHFSSQALISMLIPTMLVLLVATSFVSLHVFASKAAQAQLTMNCTLIVPAYPITPQVPSTP